MSVRTDSFLGAVLSTHMVTAAWSHKEHPQQRESDGCDPLIGSDWMKEEGTMVHNRIAAGKR